MGTADLHIHSVYSFDATTTIRDAFRQAKEVGLDVIAITDHDEIRGSIEARELAKHYGIEAIVGAEITTTEGHLIALWINDLPPKDMSLLDTLLAIGKQGGLAIAPHPFNNLPNSLSMEAVVGALTNPRAKSALRGIETHNMSTPAFNTIAQKLSIYLPLAKVGSSDAHVHKYIGAGRTEFPGRTAEDLRHALENNATVAISREGDFPTRAVLTWMRRIVLKKMGIPAETPSATQPVVTQKAQKPIPVKIKKKH